MAGNDKNSAGMTKYAKKLSLTWKCGGRIERHRDRQTDEVGHYRKYGTYIIKTVTPVSRIKEIFKINSSLLASRQIFLGVFANVEYIKCFPWMSSWIGILDMVLLLHYHVWHDIYDTMLFADPSICDDPDDISTFYDNYHQIEVWIIRSIGQDQVSKMVYAPCLLKSDQLLFVLAR